MATTAAEIKANYPIPVYNYRVDIAGETFSFTEVDGLNIEFETITYKATPIEQKAGPEMYFMPGQGTPYEITLKRGFAKGRSITYLYDWLGTIKLNQTDMRDIVISLCDEEGSPMMTWTCVNAFPVELQCPGFSTESSEIAIEGLRIMGSDVKFEEV